LQLLKEIIMNYLLLVKTAIAAIKTVEALMPESTGKDKADAALAMVEGVLGDITAQTPALLTMFTSVVNLLRSVGLFKAKAA